MTTKFKLFTLRFLGLTSNRPANFFTPLFGILPVDVEYLHFIHLYSSEMPSMMKHYQQSAQRTK
jgi:hypothetical protein